MEIRQAVIDDLPAILKIYEKARNFMKENGNPTQWAGGYPEKELLENDIKQKQCYVCVEDNQIVGVFVFIIGEDPTYQIIEQGAWHDSMTYGTIHRIASDGRIKGITQKCFDFCSKKNKYLRIDTHADNLPMQNAVQKYGFQRCGIIYVRDGSPRIAYDYLSQYKDS